MERHGWIFDLDGTLTVPQHDFAGLKRDLGLAMDTDILSGIAAFPEHEQPALHEKVKRWEEEHVAASQPAPGAHDLLKHLASKGHPIGVLTRNTKASALKTLDVIGLRDMFQDVDVLGRECATAKPAPDGVLHLLGRWGIAPQHATMVGDADNDLEAGRAAGARAIWVDHGTHRFEHLADEIVHSLSELYSKHTAKEQ